MKTFVLNGWSASEQAWDLCAFPRDRVFSYVEQLEGLPEKAVEEELEIQVAAAKNDPKLASKPDEVLKKIVAGKMGKLFYERVCLLEQPYVKDDSMKVSKYVEVTAKELGGSIKIAGFERYERGEGIEKRVDNLDEEVAKMLGK